MGSIPLPALDIKTPQQPDLLQKYGQLMALRNNQQQLQMQQQEAPYRLQALQGQAQEAQLDVQAKQQAQKNTQAMTQAYTKWDGKSYDDLAHLALENGATGDTVQKIQQHALDVKAKYSQIAKDDAATGASNIATLMKKNDVVSGALSTVLKAPDDQLPQTLTSTAQQLQQQGLLDAQHVQAAQQIAATGDPAKIRQQLEIMRKGMMSDTQQLDEAQKQAATEASKAATAKANAEIKYYADNGGVPGVPVETMAMNDWLKKNPGKGASDFLAWKAKQSPSAIVMGNQLGGNQNSDALDLAAQNYLLSGQMPPGLYRSPGTIQAIIGRAAEMNKQSGGPGIATNKAMLHANSTSLANLQKNFDQVEAFEQTAQKNMDLLQSTAKNIPDLGSRWANVPVRMLNSNMLGTANMAAFKTALATAQTEAAKVLNSSNATGVLSDSSRHELQEIIDGNVPYSALVASLNTLKQDMNNRTQSYQMQIKDIQGRIQGAGSSTPAANNEHSAAPSGADVQVKGADGKMYWGNSKTKQVLGPVQ